MKDIKHQLEQIFNQDYPGKDVFINDVLIPIFGDNLDYKNIDLEERDEHAEKAKRAGLKHVKYIADLYEQNYRSHKIAIFDVTVDDSKNIERSRVNIQLFIRQIVADHHNILMIFHYITVR